MPDSFFPLATPIDQVILVHAFGGKIKEENGRREAEFPSKIYDHYDEVISLLKPIVEPLGYRFYQIGAPNEPAVRGVESLCGKTTMSQCAYLVKNAALLIGNDSQWAHVRGHARKPLVALYGGTSTPHFPFWKGPSVLLESHRGGKKPSYATHENPKTINQIPVERVVDAALAVLNPQGGCPILSHRSLFIGQVYNQHLVELVPNVVVSPGVQMNGPLVVRMDYVADDPATWLDAEAKLAANLQIRKCAIVSDREIKLDLLGQLKPNIVQLQLDVTKLSPGWIKAVKRLGLPTGFFTHESDPEKLSALRLALYDACLFDQVTRPTKEDFVKGAAVYLNKELDKDFKWDTLRFKTNVMLLSDDKVYLSKAHWLAGRNTPSTNQNSDLVIDTPDFWQSLPSHYYYTT